ncbi:MAG: hypothetical protein LQ348_006553 [Seirophora lacunosa]|nr:MAG: hypothetical protein LQ348_006553 [Seirophora lacunosa]
MRSPDAGCGMAVTIWSPASLARSAFTVYLGTTFCRISAFAVILLPLLSSLTAALPPDSRTADLFPQSLPNLGAVTNASNALVKNQSSTTLRERTGCFQAHPSLRTVTPQDALVALGRMAYPRDFYADTYYHDETVLRRFRSASIVLTKVNAGGDAFSLFNVASQVIEIIKFCIIQETPQNWFGGLLEVGSLNRFRVVVHGRSP